MGKIQSCNKKNKNSAFTSGVFALCALYLSRTKATRANCNSLVRTVNNRLYLADVRLPGSVGLAVRVGNVVTKGNALAADTALSHFNTS